MAATDGRIRMVGGVWDQDLLNALYAGSASYLHGHSVGGTNPSLLRAMGAGAAVTAWDVNFNREVLGDTGLYFGDQVALANAVLQVEGARDVAAKRGDQARDRAALKYEWDDVAAGYEALCASLLDRARKAGYTALVVTLDTWTLAWRPHDLHHLAGAGRADRYRAARSRCGDRLDPPGARQPTWGNQNRVDARHQSPDLLDERFLAALLIAVLGLCGVLSGKL